MSTLATVTGTVIDSLRGGVLRDAVVELRPGRREAITSPAGEFTLRNVPPGTYTLQVLHSMLDTLGLAVVTPEFKVDSGQAMIRVPVAVPGPDRLVESLCTPAQRMRGPAAIVGFVRDPDTEVGIDSARVTLLYESNRDPLGILKDPNVREARPDATGRFRFCGLPAGVKGKLQVERRGVATADIPIDIGERMIELRGLSFSRSNRAVAVVTDSGRTITRYVGAATLQGRVVDKRGEPVAGARVTVAGTNSVSLSRANGEFTLDSLPTGTQTLQVRKLRYGPTEKAVDLSSSGAARVVVTMDDFIPTLAAVRSVGQREKDLEDVGFTRRKRTQGGYHLEGDQINTTGTSFTETLRMVPSLRVIQTGEWGDKFVVTDARNPGGCVNFVVDGNKWKTLVPGDIDEFLRPEEVQAIEVYGSAGIPPEFVHPLDGRCPTVVIWTRNKVRPKR